MSAYVSIEKLKVGLQFDRDVISVGRLATRDHKTYFEYDRDFLQLGLDISPLKLPLNAGLQVFDYQLFEGLPGVFNDSLPDGWGRLLFDRYLRSQNLFPDDFTALDRLAQEGTKVQWLWVKDNLHLLTI